MTVPERRVLERWGRFQARHARPVVLCWVVAVAAALALAVGAFGGGSLFSRLTSGQPGVPGENQAGRDLLDAQHDVGSPVTGVLDGVDPASPAVGRAVRALSARLAAGQDVARVSPPVTSRDGRGLAVVVQLAPGLSQQRELDRSHWVGDQLAQTARTLPGATTETGSTPQLVHDISHQVEVDLRTGERVALPISLLVMVLVFGGFLAAGLPLVGALASIAGSLASLWGFSQAIDLDATVVNVVTILGLGLSIDYGLLVVSRYREEVRAICPDAAPSRAQVEQAVGRTVAVAGRTVLFSGVIVAISLVGLLLFPAAILRALGAAGVSVVVVALMVGLGLVPAALSLAGRRLVRPGLLTHVPGLRRWLHRLGDVAPPVGVFSRLAGLVQRRPWPVALVVTAALLAAAVPALGMHLRTSGTDLMPVGSAQRDFTDSLRQDYPTLSSPDITVVTHGTLDQVRGWSPDVERLDGVTDVRPPRQEGSLVVLGVDVRGADPGSTTATRVVQELRRQDPGFPTWVVGQASGQLDFAASIASTAPWSIALVVLATFALLFLMTGSVLVPLKALVMNVVSLGASLGLVTWVFQGGHLRHALSFTPTGGVETTIPPLVLAFAFGLAMDYEVFLLSRIKEQRDAGHPNDEAVVAGLQRSGRIITSAALLVVIVFAGLVTGKVIVVQETGVALVAAVAIDATLVRMLLVPATMTLLGEWNWWAPGPLRRLHDRFGIGAH